MLVVAICMMIFTLFYVNTFGRNDRSLFGYKFYIAQTSSMAATDFKAGDIVVSKANPDTSTLSEGDIITFISQSELHYGKTVTHKIRKININENGSREFVTYGSTTNTNDDAPVPEEYVIGKYNFRIPSLGSFIAFLKTAPGYITCILIPFLIVIILNGIDCFRLLQKYKAEKDFIEQYK